VNSGAPLCHTQFVGGRPEHDPKNIVNISESPSSTKSKPRVLIVDDERLIADTLAEILNESGFQAIAVYGGKTALEQVSTFCPDTLICDVIMPGVNGIEIAKTVREICPTARILLLSGQAATTDLMKRAKDQGYSFELLAKPLHPEILLKKLSQ
jgi:DNA-binding response OmpR family regulator